MSTVFVVLPHQLFRDPPFPVSAGRIFLVEEDLFFRQVPFHKRKLAFHRASMRYYQDYLTKAGAAVTYVQSGDPDSDIRQLVARFAGEGVREINAMDPADDWLEKRLRKAAGHHSLKLSLAESPLFIDSRQSVEEYVSNRSNTLQTHYYIHQRKKHGILLAPGGKPSGGKWTYDQENRQRYPADRSPPQLHWPASTSYIREAAQYVETNFPHNPGQLDPAMFFPHTHADAERWLENFLEERFPDFGPYQDALVSGQSYLHHSVISPMLNAGLITPMQVISRAVEFAGDHRIPLNSLEGFVRQILGWREYIRGIYHVHGVRQRTQNFWGHHARIPDSFWTGRTGLAPVDEVIAKVLQTGYAHHIERLMVLGNIMLLCEFDPDEVYRWFMALFVDAYDWVMVPNVYGMSQYADGGLLATKPYISGSNYLKKMGNHPSGAWQEIWDGLFWRFISVNNEVFGANPRLRMLVRSLERMDPQRRQKIFMKADGFMGSLNA